MRMQTEEEIRKAVAKCISTGQILSLSDQARSIAERCRADLHVTEDALLKAAVAAHVNIVFGRLQASCANGPVEACPTERNELRHIG